jgi:hypothetical protein
VPEDDIYKPEPDDDDTGPLHISTTSPPVDDDWDRAPAQGTWAGRFDAPLSVSPRPVQSPRNPKVWLGAVAAAVAAVVVIGGLVFWLTRPSSDAPEPAAEPTTTAPPESPTPSEDDERLLDLLPKGYASDSCEPAAEPKDALAQVDCEKNTDPGGPLSAAYALARDKAALDAAFNDTIQSANRVNCPGNIQSPGPWRRNAAPDKVAGMLYCGLREGQPTVIWTDDAELTVNAVQSGPGGPTFPELYAWWASHS